MKDRERIIKRIDKVINMAVNIRLKEIMEGRVYQLKEEHKKPNNMRKERGDKHD